MDPRLQPTVPARLRLIDAVLSAEKTRASKAASAAPVSSVKPMAAAQAQWEKTFEAQKARALSQSLHERGRLSLHGLTTPAVDTFRTQIVSVTSSVPKTSPAPVVAPKPAVASAPASVPTPAAAPAIVQKTATPEAPLLPLNEIAQHQGLLDRADVHFDAPGNRWSAEWPTPRPFHYGMILKPTLTQYMKEGQVFSFQDGSNQTQTICNRGGEIVVEKDKASRVVDSQGLKHLLLGKIRSNGFELYMTARGSLVLATTGDAARSLALVR